MCSNQQWETRLCSWSPHSSACPSRMLLHGVHWATWLLLNNTQILRSVLSAGKLFSSKTYWKELNCALGETGREVKSCSADLPAEAPTLCSIFIHKIVVRLFCNICLFSSNLNVYMFLWSKIFVKVKILRAVNEIFKVSNTNDCLIIWGQDSSCWSNYPSWWNCIRD